MLVFLGEQRQQRLLQKSSVIKPVPFSSRPKQRVWEKEAPLPRLLCFVLFFFRFSVAVDRTTSTRQQVIRQIRLIQGRLTVLTLEERVEKAREELRV